MSIRLLSSAAAFAAATVLPVLAPAATMTPAPMHGAMMAVKHHCRDAKGHFIKGMYLKCPAGTHKA